MFDDEMTEANLANTSADYCRINQIEAHEEKLAVAQAYIRALEAQVHGLIYYRNIETMAMLAAR